MKRISIPKSFLPGIIGVLVIITLFYDILKYYSSVNFASWNYINETINLLIVVLYYFYLRTRPFYNETNVQQNLKNFIKLLALILIISFLAKIYLVCSSHLLCIFYRMIIVSDNNMYGVFGKNFT